MCHLRKRRGGEKRRAAPAKNHRFVTRALADVNIDVVSCL
ncbi:hypothetical protein HMPREF0262_02055 [Clostridium sp. ATCC 29733]|nr:hypothetical protein HMPREF0262_02055 [Clostridium sp. ATCC 29733]